MYYDNYDDFDIKIQPEELVLPDEDEDWDDNTDEDGNWDIPFEDYDNGSEFDEGSDRDNWEDEQVFQDGQNDW